MSVADVCDFDITLFQFSLCNRMNFVQMLNFNELALMVGQSLDNALHYLEDWDVIIDFGAMFLCNTL